VKLKQTKSKTKKKERLKEIRNLQADNAHSGVPDKYEESPRCPKK